MASVVQLNRRLALRRNPGFYLCVQDVQRQGPAANDLIVKCAKIELVAQLLTGFLA